MRLPEKTCADRCADPYPFGRTLAAAGTFIFAWALVHLGFFAHAEIIDTPVYQHYGDNIVHGGLIPYRDFALEYPPAALPVFVLASLAGHYADTFSDLMACCGVAIIFLIGLRRPPLWQYVILALWPLLTGALIFSRFDLWPALLVTAALLAFVRGRGPGHDRLGWILLAVAAAAKIWPLVLVPLLLISAHRRGRMKDALAGAAAFAVCVVPFVIVSAHGFWNTISGQLSRPLQIESLGGAAVMALGHPQIVMSHGSQNLAGQGWLAALLTVAGALALIGVWTAFARGPISDERLCRYSAAAACAFVAFGKVLSPQFLIWLLPLCLLVRGTSRRGQLATALLVAAMILTQLWFPSHYWQYVYTGARAWIVLSRDLLLVALLAVLLVPTAAEGEAGTDTHATRANDRCPSDPASASS